MNLHDWLGYQGILTRKLAELKGEVSIDIIAEGEQNPSNWDKEVLSIIDDICFYREVMIYAHEQACWYGRTIIPKTVYQNNLDFFQQLQYTSLGELVAKSPNVEREELIFYPIDTKSTEFYWYKQISAANNYQESLWVRRSNFKINKEASFFLFELFLPDFYVWLGLSP